MNIENINIFILTFQKGNFAAAAKQLNKSPSSVSRAVAGLEEQLKTRLFQRNTRTLTPTLAGVEYYARMLPLLDEVNNIHQNIKLGNNDLTGTLRISASTSYAQIVLPPVLKSFCTQYPKIQLDLTLSDTRIDLIENQIDVAIRHGNLSDSTLIARKLQDVSYYLVASPGYLTKMKPLRAPEDLSQHQVIAFNYSEFAKHWHFSNRLNNTSIVIHPFMRVSNAAMIKHCLLTDMGVSLLADWTVKPDLDKSNLTRLLSDWSITGESQDSAIWLVQPSKTFVPRKVKVFTDFLMDYVNNINIR